MAHSEAIFQWEKKNSDILPHGITEKQSKISAI